MKRFFTTFVILLPLTIIAQTQLGYVRTAGSAKEKGEPLPGVTIRVEGISAVVSDESGAFTMALSNVKSEGDGFWITSVRLPGYELVDKDALSSPFVFSTSVPIEIVMISSLQLLKTRQEIEERARINATKRYEKQIKNLKKQLAKHKITTSEYIDKINKLERQMESFESLISAMADYYARTDYDRLDSLNAEINRCIANGELERADSLIDSKGDVIKRAHENIKKGQRINEAEKDIQKLKQKFSVTNKIQRKEKKSIEN